MASCLPGKGVVRGVAVIETVRQQQNGSCPSSEAGSRYGRTVHLVSNEIQYVHVCIVKQATPKCYIIYHIPFRKAHCSQTPGQSGNQGDPQQLPVFRPATTCSQR